MRRLFWRAWDGGYEQGWRHASEDQAEMRDRMVELLEAVARAELLSNKNLSQRVLLNVKVRSDARALLARIKGQA